MGTRQISNARGRLTLFPHWDLSLFEILIGRETSAGPASSMADNVESGAQLKSARDESRMMKLVRHQSWVLVYRKIFSECLVPFYDSFKECEKDKMIAFLLERCRGQNQEPRTGSLRKHQCLSKPLAAIRTDQSYLS